MKIIVISIDSNENTTWFLMSQHRKTAKKSSVCKTVIETSYEDDIIDCIENTKNFVEISLQILRNLAG